LSFLHLLGLIPNVSSCHFGFDSAFSPTHDFNVQCCLALRPPPPTTEQWFPGVVFPICLVCFRPEFFVRLFRSDKFHPFFFQQIRPFSIPLRYFLVCHLCEDFFPFPPTLKLLKGHVFKKLLFRGWSGRTVPSASITKDWEIQRGVQPLSTFP